MTRFYLVALFYVPILHLAATKAARLKSQCEYFGPPVSKIQSKFDPEIFLDTLFINQASRPRQIETYCHNCVNGTLVTKQELKQIIPNLPQIIGVTYDMAQEKFFWLDDGSPVGQLDQYNVSSVIYPSDIANMSEWYGDSRFMVYALPDNWRGEDSTPEAYKTPESDQQRQSRSGMKWFVMPSSADLNYELKSDWQGYWRGSATREERARAESYDYIMCKRPKRPTCHTWSYELSCFPDEQRVGCEKLIYTMQMDPDDNSAPKCQNPSHQSQTVTCPMEMCTCQMEPWSEWSQCCGMARNRTRYPIRGKCPKIYYRPTMLETEPCQKTADDMC